MNNLSKRFRTGGPSVERLFVRSQNARTVMNGPSMMAVLGMGGRPNAAAALGSFAGGGFGALPEFSAPDMGRGQNLLNQIRGDLDSLLLKAKQVQVDATSATQRAEGAQLQDTMTALEGSIATAWSRLLDFIRVYGQRMAAMEAVATGARSYERNGRVITWSGAPEFETFRTSTDSFGRPNQFTAADYNAAHAVYLRELGERQADLAAAQAEINKQKAVVAGLLGEYITKVPTAAALVQAAVVAEVRAETAKKVLNTTKIEAQTTGQQVATFVAQQQLDQLVKTADDAKKKANAAAAQISTGSSKLPWILAGALAIGVGVYLFKRKR